MSNCRSKVVSATFSFFFKHELLSFNANIYIENGLKIIFSPITCLLGINFQ